MTKTEMGESEPRNPSPESLPRLAAAAAVAALVAAVGFFVLRDHDASSGETPETATTEPSPNADAGALPDDPALAARLQREPEELEALTAAAAEHDVDPDLVAAVAWHESRWDQQARSHAGAVGVMQLMPSTAERVAEDVVGEPLDPRDAEDNARLGAAYLAALAEDFDDTRDVLIAYNQGPDALEQDGPYSAAETFADRVLQTRDELTDVDWQPSA